MASAQPAYTFFKKKLFKKKPSTAWVSHAVDLLIDGYVVSYMKCGRTWLTNLLNSYIAHVQDNAHIQKNISLDAPPYLKTIGKSTLPNIVLTHDITGGTTVPADNLASLFSPKRYQKKRTVFLARNPSDVIISLFHHRKKNQMHTHNDVASFIQDQQHGLRRVILYYNLWAPLIRANKNMSLVTYEDLRQNPQTTLTIILQELGFPHISNHSVHFSVDQNTFANMQKKEKEHKKMKEGSTHNSQTLRVREGGINKAKTVLEKDTYNFVTQMINEQLDPLFSMYKNTPKYEQTKTH